MTESIVNLLLAVFLLAANAFYVAAEFALVKSRGFRINAMVGAEPLRRAPAAADDGQHRGLSRLLPARHHHGLARPRLGRRADGVGAARAGADPARRCRKRPCTSPSFLVGFLVFSSLHIVIGEQVPKTLAIREPVPVSQWIAYPLYVVLPGVLSAELAAQRGVARDPADARRQGSLAARNPDRRRDRGAGARSSAEHGEHREGEAEYIHERLPLRRARRSPTSWSTAPRW